MRTYCHHIFVVVRVRADGRKTERPNCYSTSDIIPRTYVMCGIVCVCVRARARVCMSVSVCVCVSVCLCLSVSQRTEKRYAPSVGVVSHGRTIERED